MKDFKEPVTLVKVRAEPSDKARRDWRARFEFLSKLYPDETQSGIAVVGPMLHVTVAEMEPEEERFEGV